jgi:hypothetical protein
VSLRKTVLVFTASVNCRSSSQSSRGLDAALSQANFKSKKETRMHLIKRLGSATQILSAMLLLTACPSQTTISQINADPARYRNKEVAIVGTVRDSYGAHGQGAYEIDDGTGRLWVVTRRGVPSRGARVGAKGHVYTGFNFGGRNYGTVLEETDRSSKAK